MSTPAPLSVLKAPVSDVSFAGLLDYARREDVFGASPGFARFYEALGLEAAKSVERLWAATCLLDAGDAGASRRLSEFVVRNQPDEDDDRGAAGLRTFAEALLERATGPSEGGNLYLGARPPGAQLRAFELMRLRTPLIPFAYAAANRALLALLGEQAKPVTLIDIGIGRGGQVRSLLRNPMSRDLISRLHVVGVEPDSASGGGGGALELARQRVLEAAEAAGIPTTFSAIGKRAEHLDVSDLERAGLEGVVLANAAFALHHVDHQGGGGLDRDAVLGALARVADGLVIVEPDSNHFTDDLRARFLYAYRHYETVRRSLRARLARADATLVWGEFFAPEVRNVMACESSERTERHEEHATWVGRLRGAGWNPAISASLVPASAAPRGFSLEREPESFSLAFQGVSLVSVMAATS